MCEACGKLFVTKASLTYHVDHKVCTSPTYFRVDVSVQTDLGSSYDTDQNEPEDSSVVEEDIEDIEKKEFQTVMTLHDREKRIN